MKYIKPEMSYVNLGISESVSVTVTLCIQCPDSQPIRGDFEEDIAPFAAGCVIGEVDIVDFAS